MVEKFGVLPMGQKYAKIIVWKKQSNSQEE